MIKKLKYIWGKIDLLTLIMLLIVGQYLYWVGFHNFDSSQNLEYMELTQNLFLCENNVSKYLEYKDFNWDGSLNTHAENYLRGVRQNSYGFYLSIFSLILINIKINNKRFRS